MHFGQKAPGILSRKYLLRNYRNSFNISIEVFQSIGQKSPRIQTHLYLFNCECNISSKQPFDQVRYQQTHNLLAYMIYMCSILSLQCIKGRFSTVLVFGCFVSGRHFVPVFWSIFLEMKAKQDQSGSFFLFNFLCE